MTPGRARSPHLHRGVTQALGLHSDYGAEGRVITQAIDPGTLPVEMQRHLLGLKVLGGVYKQLDAPFGEFGHDSELVSTRATASESTDDAVYRGFDEQLETCAGHREAVAGQINRLLNGVEFEGAHVSDWALLALSIQGEELIGQMHLLSGLSQPPAFQVCG